jgi:hypothetical protein
MAFPQHHNLGFEAIHALIPQPRGEIQSLSLGVRNKGSRKSTKQ